MGHFRGSSKVGFQVFWGFGKKIRFLTRLKSVIFSYQIWDTGSGTVLKQFFFVIFWFFWCFCCKSAMFFVKKSAKMSLFGSIFDRFWAKTPKFVHDLTPKNPEFWHFLQFFGVFWRFFGFFRHVEKTGFFGFFSCFFSKTAYNRPLIWSKNGQKMAIFVIFGPQKTPFLSVFLNF